MKRLRRALAATILATTAAMWLQAPQRLMAWSGHTPPGRWPSDAATACAPDCTVPPVTVMTLNVLCGFCDKEGYDAWEARQPQLRALIEAHSPDLIGLQEVADMADARALLPEQYDIVAARWGRGRYTDAILAVRTARFAVEDEGALWLSPSPELPLSWGWAPLAFPRMLTWARLRDAQTGAPLLLASTHIDNNLTNKDNGAGLIGDAVAGLAARLPVILTGDFNTHPGQPRFATIQRDLIEVSDVSVSTQQRGVLSGIPHTRRELKPDRRIDHILVGGPGAVSVLEWVHHAPTYGDPPRRPSDHPAVIATVQFGESPHARRRGVP